MGRNGPNFRFGHPNRALDDADLVFTVDVRAGAITGLSPTTADRTSRP
jgi:hypothetical protein